MLRRLLPYPFASLVVLLTWLLLVNRLDPAHLALAAALAIVVPRITARFAPESGPMRRPGVALQLFLVFLADMVVANFAIAALVLGPAARLQPRFIEVPLDLRSPVAIATLAGIVSLTPGTVSVEISSDRRRLLVHCLRVLDEARAVADIKSRYERRLLEIFPC